MHKCRLIASVLIVFVSCLSNAQDLNNPPSPAQPEHANESIALFDQRLALLQQQLSALQAQISASAAKTDRAESVARQFQVIGWVVGASAVIIGLISLVAGVFGWQRIKERVSRHIERRFAGSVDSQLTQKVNERLSRLEENAEQQLIKLTEVLSLCHTKHFDEALAAYGWKDEITHLRTVKPVFRRAIIQCLAGSAFDKERRREFAWEAIQELWQESKSNESLLLYLKLGVKQRKYTDALRSYGESAPETRDRDCDLLAATCLRKLGKKQEALQIAAKYSQTQDFHAANTLASLYRDLGDFNRANDLLRSKVEMVLRSRGAKIPDGWAQVFNSYIASCIDRNRPEDGVPAAEFLIRVQRHPISVFNAALLAVELNSANPDRARLLSTIERALPDLPLHDATEKAEALVACAHNKLDDAVAIMRRSLKELTASPTSKGDDIYFAKCLLARLLRLQNKPKDAIALLQEETRHEQYGGEALYELALAYASDRNEEEAANWLRIAAKDRPLWAAKARDHEVLSSLSKVIEVLGELAQSRVLSADMLQPRLNFQADGQHSTGIR